VKRWIAGEGARATQAYFAMAEQAVISEVPAEDAPSPLECDELGSAG
jgi:hypothetical protein